MKKINAHWFARVLLIITVAVAGTPLPGHAAPEVVAWGDNSAGQTNVPSGLSNVVAIAAGGFNSLALTAESRMVAWGANDFGQTNVASGLSNVVAIATGGLHCLALTDEGRVVGWGGNWNGPTNVPSGLSNVVAIAAGDGHSLALTTAGRVVAWGGNWSGQTNVPGGLSNVMAIAARGSFSLALTAEGRVVAWGDNSDGQTTVPSGLGKVVAIAAGAWHSLALTAEGRVVAWGDNGVGQTNVPGGLTNVVAIAAGADFSLALTTDGRPVVWGRNSDGQANVPGGLNDVVAIAAGNGHSLALIGLPPGMASPAWIGPRLLVATVERPFQHRIMVRNGATAYGAVGLPPGLVLDQGTGLITGWPAEAGTYSVVLSATNNVGSCAWPVTLFVNGQVDRSLPTITSQPQSQTNVFGSSARFSVVAMGSAPLSYQWRFSGLPLVGQTGTNLTLANVQSTNAGNYDVVVTNAFGSVTSAVAILTMISPIVTVCDEETLRAPMEAGGTVTLACDGTIRLTRTLVITKDVVLDGTGRYVALDGGGAVRIFLVQPHIQLTLRHLTVTRGRADQGGGLLNDGGAVVLLDSVFHSNQAVGNDTNYLDAVGGAVYSIAGEVAATNCLFATNGAMRGHVPTYEALGIEARGGAIAMQDGVLKLADCQFTSNQAAGGISQGGMMSASRKGGGFGGAVFLQSSEGHAWDCQFDDNLAHSPEIVDFLLDVGADVQGGAIHQEGARLLELQDCALVGNRALGGGGGRNGSNRDGRGGAISAGGNLVADHCSFESNACVGGQGGAFDGGHAFGGALYTINTATLNHCLFSANWAMAGSGCYCGGMGGGLNGNADGGAIYAQGALQILNSTLASNWVEAQDINTSADVYPRPGSCAGGALFSTAVCVVTNSTWFQNRAVAQRQIRFYFGEDHSSEGSVAGAAIYQSGNPLALVFCTIASNAIVSLPTNTSAAIVRAGARLSGCILSGNTYANLAGSIVDGGFNLSSDHSVFLVAASSRNDVDPRLGVFGNHGGPTPTLALLIDSPAIDAVTSGAFPETDQRGVLRPSGARCDIGAFEFVWPAPLFTWDSTGSLRVKRVLPPSRDYQIDASSDLVHWILLSTTRSDDQGKIEFTDSTANNWPFRFYRAVPK